MPTATGCRCCSRDRAAARPASWRIWRPARPPAPHRLLPRRPDRGRPDRPLPAQGRRHGLGRWAADPCRPRGRHLLSRRSGGSAQGRHRRAAPADRRPPPAAAGTYRRTPRSPARIHAGRLLQSRLPEHPEVAEALDPPAVHRHRVRLPASRRRNRHRRAGERPAAGAGGAPGASRQRAAGSQGTGSGGGRFDPPARLLRGTDPVGPEA